MTSTLSNHQPALAASEQRERSRPGGGSFASARSPSDAPKAARSRPLATTSTQDRRRREVVARTGFAEACSWWIATPTRLATDGCSHTSARTSRGRTPRSSAASISRTESMSRCRRVTARGLRDGAVAPRNLQRRRWDGMPGGTEPTNCSTATVRLYRLELVQTGMSIPELRWQRRSARRDRSALGQRRGTSSELSKATSPCATLTQHRARAAPRRPGRLGDACCAPSSSACSMSPIVLNRALREAVLATVAA